MSRETVERVLAIEMPILLPDVRDNHDGRLRRVEEVLVNRKGILKAHVKTDPASGRGSGVSATAP